MRRINFGRGLISLPKWQLELSVFLLSFSCLPKSFGLLAFQTLVGLSRKIVVSWPSHSLQKALSVHELITRIEWRGHNDIQSCSLSEEKCWLGAPQRGEEGKKCFVRFAKNVRSSSSCQLYDKPRKLNPSLEWARRKNENGQMQLSCENANWNPVCSSFSWAVFLQINKSNSTTLRKNTH